jgi:tetratricopeptide (TPR) repeat protein
LIGAAAESRISRLLCVALYWVCAAVVLGACHAQPQEHTASSRAHPLAFTTDVAPILFEHCSACHRAGQSAPFPLLTYQHVRSRARQIVDVTARRYMPPWLPEAGGVPFREERRLSDDQIEVLRRWVDEGAVEGDPADLPPQPTWTDGWQLGQPDMIVALPQPYTLQPGPPDVFRNFVLPIALPQTRFVRAMEFRPGTASVIHHAVFKADRTSASRRRDGRDGIPGYDGMLPQNEAASGNRFLGWTPGRGPVVEPPDMPWPLERGSDLVVQLHLLPGGKPEVVQPTLGLFFSDTPATRAPLTIKLGSKAIDIPPGAGEYSISDSYVLPVDVDLIGLYPHAHYLAKQMLGTATLPDGSIMRLIWIKQWDFHWQQDYRLTTPLALPRGTTLSMRYTYDNSDRNVRNPHHPPQRVVYGARATEEMGDLWLQVVPRTPEAAGTLARAFFERDAMASVEGGELLVRRFPDRADHHEFLGSSYLQVGRIDEGIHHLEQALRLDPQSSAAHNALAEVLSARGRLAAAIEHLRAAVRFDPRNELLLFNLANVLNAAGRRDEAENRFRASIAANPDFAEGHNNLGVLVGSLGRTDEAVTLLRRAVAIDSEYAEAHNNLSAMLARQGAFDQAVAHARRAVEIRPNYREARENLHRLLGAAPRQNHE